MDSVVFLLILSISFSGGFLILFAILYIDRLRHISKIKKMLHEDSEEIRLELIQQREKRYKNSIEYKIRSFMNHAGFYKYQLTIFFISYFLIVLLFSFLFISFLNSVVGGAVGIIVGTFLHFYIIKTLINRRLLEFNKALAIAISVLVKMMRNGIGFEQSIQKAVDVSSSKLFKSVFNTYFQEKNTFGEEKAFENMLNVIDSKELKIFAISVKIGRESGGRFSQTLQKLETTIRFRKKIQDKIDVVTREGSVGSYIVAMIAVVLYFLLNINFDGKLHEYYMQSAYGRYQLLGIGLWILIGLVINKAITRVKS